MTHQSSEDVFKVYYDFIYSRNLDRKELYRDIKLAKLTSTNTAVMVIKVIRGSYGSGSVWWWRQ